MGNLVGAGCASLLTGCDALPSGGTLQARELHGVWTVFFWGGAFVAAIVYGLISWCLLRYRKAPGETAYPRQFRRNNAMEITYTVIPILMVGGLFALTYAAERHVETIAKRQDVVVDVTAFRWGWRFDYPQLGVRVTGTAKEPPEFVVPLDETTRFDISSVDVDHSFWVPAFLFKRDAIPGLQNEFDWTPNRAGVFRGECGEFCGLDHALMTFRLRVAPRADFDRWIRERRGVALAASVRAR